MHALGELGVDARGAQPALEKAKLDADPVVRFQALDSLARIQASEGLDVKAFHDGLKSADPRTRQAAAHYLGRQRVLDLRASKDDQLRAGALEAIDKKWVGPRLERP